MEIATPLTDDLSSLCKLYRGVSIKWRQLHSQFQVACGAFDFMLYHKNTENVIFFWGADLRSNVRDGVMFRCSVSELELSLQMSCFVELSVV